MAIEIQDRCAAHRRIGRNERNARRGVIGINEVCHCTNSTLIRPSRHLALSVTRNALVGSIPDGRIYRHNDVRSKCDNQRNHRTKAKFVFLVHSTFPLSLKTIPQQNWTRFRFRVFAFLRTSNRRRHKNYHGFLPPLKKSTNFCCSSSSSP